MIPVIPPPPSELLPPWSVDVFAAVGWILLGIRWWLTRRK